MHIIILIIVAITLYLLQSYAYKAKWNKHLDIDIQFSTNRAMCGDNIYLTEIISNKKLLPLPMLRIKFMTSRDLVFDESKNTTVSDNFYRSELVSILSFQKLTRKLKFNCSHRGYYTINKADIICDNIFLSYSYVQTKTFHEILYVYPKCLNRSIIELPFKHMMGDILTKRFINEDPFEFAGIREYQPYDNRKNVNWKASAKTGSLKVNVHDYTSSQQVSILLNLETQTLLSHDELMEESIRLAATYAAVFIKMGVPVSLYTNGFDLLLNQPIQITSGTTSDHLTKINEGLSRIDLTKTPIKFMSYLPSVIENCRQDYILYISTYQKEDFQNYLMEQKRDHIDFTWIVPLDPDIKSEVYNSLKNDSFIHYRTERGIHS